MFLTRAVRGCDSGFEVPCGKMQAPCHAIVFGQTEATVSWHNKDLRSGVTRRFASAQTLRITRPREITEVVFCLGN